MTGRLVVVGDALLDRDVEGSVERLAPDAPVPVVDETSRASRPGGAGLAATLAAADGHPVTLITALAGDPAGRELAALLAEAGVEVVDLGLEGTTPEKVRIRTGGRSLLRLDRGRTPGTVGPLTDAASGALRSADAVLVSDYGRGVSAEEGLRRALADLSPRTPVVWDPHPRGSEPVPGVRLATPNRPEAAGLVPEVEGESPPALAEKARLLAARWRAAGVAVTLGEGGALLAGENGEPFLSPAPAVDVADPCGAGDRFASRAAGLLAGGAPLREAVAGAVLAASRFVATGGAAGLNFGEPREPLLRRAGEPGDAEEVIARVRREGGAVVATGGCFDLLHAGHVGTLQAARALGDCLVVCLNSDASVRRLKGSDRPLVPEEDRAAVLLALGCVDAVVLFDEATPEAALDRLRPDVFAKGGDYAVSELPEARLLERWGGRAVILPYVAGRSTTRLIEEAVSRGARQL
jgi:D-beta-D-heptose 7-phosphate kinase/D-beta-D-heptose 1-phosphate adenosyltransferase